MSEHAEPWDLHLLPGEVGASALLEGRAIPSLEQTEVFERIVFPALQASPSGAQARSPYAGWTKAQLYAKAKELGIRGRSKLSKASLRRALEARAA